MTRRAQPPGGWTARAGRLGELLPLERWHPAVLAQVRRSRADAPWCVALSGGADSVALLLALWAHFPARRPNLLALHFDHRLRGRASTADARFCRALCRRLGVACREGRWDAAVRGGSEAASRAARHDFFAAAMGEAGARILWLAHQQDDVVETMLMRLARGSGTGGLAAPRPVQLAVGRRVHLRPFLTLTKAELVAALRAAGCPWREDASNRGDRHFRNRVRHDLLPRWEAVSGRAVRAAVALSRERLQEDDDALEEWLGQIGPVDRRRRELDLAKLAGRPLALWRRALQRWLGVARVKTDLSRAGFEQLLAAARRGRATRFSLGVDAFAVVRGGKLRVERL